MSSALAVTLLTGPLTPTGRNAELFDLAAGLHRGGVDVTVVGGRGPLGQRFRQAGHTVKLLDLSARLPLDLAVFPALLRAVRDAAPDLIHVIDEAMARHGAALSRLLDRRWIVNLSGAVSPPNSRRLCFILVNGRGARDDLALLHGVAPGRIRQIDLGVDTGRFADLRVPFADGIPVIGTLAPLSSGSRLTSLIDAVKILLEGGRRLHCLIAGHGPAEAVLRRRARELGITRDVTITAPPGEFEQVLASFDVFVSMGRDGAGILQAMAAARPVVAIGVGEAFRILREGRTGILVPRRDPPALAGRIGRLLDDPAAAAELGRTARKAAERRFAVDAAASRVEDVYREVIGGEP